MHDEEIISLYRKRDPDAIARTEEAYGTACRALAGRILRAREDAEECVNDSYYRLWDSIPPERPQSLAAYLSKVLRNLCLDRLREQNALKRGGNDLTLALDELENVCGSSDVESSLSAKELGKAVDSFLRTQPQRNRNVFLRRYFYFETRAEIAQRYGISQAQVSVILSRVRKKLRAYLIKEGLL